MMYYVTLSAKDKQYKKLVIAAAIAIAISETVNLYENELENDTAYTIVCRTISDKTIMHLLEIEDLLLQREKNIKEEDEKIIHLIETRYGGITNSDNNSDEIIWSLENTIKQIAHVLDLTKKIYWIDRTKMEKK